MIRQLMKYVHFLRKKFPHMEGVYLAYRDSRYRAMGKGKCVKCLVNGFSLTFELDPKDLCLSSELASEKIHEPLTMQLLTDIIKPGWTVVDIGSHLGYFPLFEACLVEPGGKVIAS